MIRSRSSRLAAAVLTCCAAVPAVSCGPPADRPNVVLVTIDTLRADHTSVYGYTRDTTPALALLAAQSTVFDAAYATMPTTGPSHSSMFTSKPPLGHGVVRNGFVLPEEHDTLAEVLQRAGYCTAAFISSSPVRADFGFDQGFELFDADFRNGHPSMTRANWEGHELDGNAFDRRADVTTNTVLEWLSRGSCGDRPVFLWVHYFDPHDPYSAPEPWRWRYSGEDQQRDLEWVRGQYDAEVLFTDAQVDRLIRGMEPVLSPTSTLLIVTADHGESLGEHDYLGHGAVLFEQTVRVPLIVRWPGASSAGVRIAEPVTLLDLMPTALAEAGIGVGELPMQGLPLQRYLGNAVAESPDVFLQRRLYNSEWQASLQPFGLRLGASVQVGSPHFAIRRGRWKLQWQPELDAWELYDLREDPLELSPVPEQGRRQLADALIASIEIWRRAQTALQGQVEEADAQLLEDLRAMGYVQ